MNSKWQLRILRIIPTYGDEKGMILIVVLALIAILTLVGTTAVITTTTDIKISSNYKNSIQAFYAAEAGYNRIIGEYINNPNYYTAKSSATTVGLTTTDPCMANFCSNTANWFPNNTYGSSTPPAFVDVESYGKVLGINSHSASNGAQIPLTQVADISYVMGPAMISSENALLRAYVLMNMRDRGPLSFVEEASKVISQK